MPDKSNLTKAKLLEFIRIRNKAVFSSNLQFQIDLGEAGLKVADLGDARQGELGRYEWDTPFGLLVEHPGGQMELVEQSA